jgi:hypothetical protein
LIDFVNVSLMENVCCGQNETEIYFFFWNENYFYVWMENDFCA